MHLQYGGESGCDDMLVVDDKNAWTLVGRHICPLSSTFFVNRKSAIRREDSQWRFE